MAVQHALDTFATSLGTSLRGMRRCAKTLNLLRVPETPQAAAVGGHSQCLLDDWTLANACQFLGVSCSDSPS